MKLGIFLVKWILVKLHVMLSPPEGNVLPLFPFVSGSKGIYSWPKAETI